MSNTKEQIDAWYKNGGVKTCNSNYMEKEIITSLIITLTDFLNKIDASEIRNIRVESTKDSVDIKIKKKDVTIFIDLCTDADGKTCIGLDKVVRPVLDGVRIPIIRQDITDYGLRKDALVCAVDLVKKLYEDDISDQHKMRIRGVIDMIKNLMND